MTIGLNIRLLLVNTKLYVNRSVELFASAFETTKINTTNTKKKTKINVNNVT